MEDAAPAETLLSAPSCLECGKKWVESTERWRAYVADQVELLIYCEDCASREFDS